MPRRRPTGPDGLPVPLKKSGPKPWAPTDDQIEKIKLYAGLGTTQDQVARLVGIGQSTFRANAEAKAAFEDGKVHTIARVAGSLVKKALAGDTTSAIFYLKTQAGWKETQHVDLLMSYSPEAAAWLGRK